jgi:uncharacterized OB-fold protein
MEPVAEGLFETRVDGSIVLIGATCAACARPHFPLGPSCPYCGAPDVSPLQLSRVGTLWGWTIVHTAPPGYDGRVPFGFGVVELPEGLRIITRLDATGPLEFGMPMTLTALTVEADHGPAVTWSFVPPADTASSP